MKERHCDRLTLIKKIILVVCLISMGLIIGCNRDRFWIEKEYTAAKKGSISEISLIENEEIRQNFLAKEDGLISVKIPFKAWEKSNASGSITVEIQDQDQNILCSEEKKVKKLVQSKTSNETTFSAEAELTEGQIYTVVIRGNDIQSEKGVFLYKDSNNAALFPALTVDGTNSKGHIQMTFRMDHYSSNSMVMMFVLLGIGIIFVVIPFDRMKIHGKKGNTIESNKLLARIFFFVSPVVAFMIVQRYSGYGITAFLKLCLKPKGILNIFLYGLLWWLIYLICNRTKYTAVIFVTASSVLGLANYFVWQFRGIPVMMADIASISTAAKVAENYDYILDISSLWALTYTVVFDCIVLSLKSYKGLTWKKRICVLLGFLVPYSVYYTQLLHGTLLKDHGITVSVWDPSRNYASNGSLLSFFLSYTYYTVDKPDNYSVEKVEEIAERYPSDSVEDNHTQRPNIIAIMNEAFSDLDVDGDLETSEDYMPYIHSLTEDTVKGDLYVSVLAGNTANSEFEFLTGCSMAFLPFRSIPYDSYVKAEFPSLTHNLEDMGYAGNIAFHPATKTAWSRDVVYPLFGFEEFYTVSDMEKKNYVRNFVSDQSDFEFLINAYEEADKLSDDPFYAFNVTIQNHGGYKSSQGMVDTPITITNAQQKDSEAEQYINLVKMTDTAFEELVGYFSNVEEPTVIVMFGDHQPSLSTSFYESLFGKKSSQFTLEDTIKQYTVPYMIWANYDIEEETVNMSANYLSAYLMKVIGAELTGYQKYLLELMEEVPLITANGYRGADGVLHELDEKSEYSDKIKEYQLIQYNNLFDSSNRVQEFYQLAQ
ncbi:MAG: LTA synthase family protein [Muricoprocola sp.]